MNKPSTTDKNSEEEKYQEKISSYIKREVNGLLEDGSIPVRIAVYDFLSGKFKGYKTDTYWSTDKRVPKIHPLKDTGISGPLLKNFLGLLNGRRNKNLEPVNLEVVVEEIDSEGNLKSIKNR